MDFPIKRVVLYKHGVGYFERETRVEDDVTLELTFKQAEVSDVLKSLTVLDLNGGLISSVSYDSTKPLKQLLAEVSLSIPDQGSLVSLLPQIKGARVMLHSGVADPVEGVVLGIDASQKQTGEGVVEIVLLSIVTDTGAVRTFDLHSLASVQILDPALRRDLDFYLKTQLSSKKKDDRTFTFFAQGQGLRTVRLSYTLEAPVWKATYRILLGEEASQLPTGGARGGPAATPGEGDAAKENQPFIQGWAVVDNMQDEDWEDVQLSLVAGLPVSFVHDLYTPRYIRRPEVRVQETTGVVPPMVEEGMYAEEIEMAKAGAMMMAASAPSAPMRKRSADKFEARAESAVSSTPAHVRDRKIGDLFEYEIEHPVTIRRNQSALVPIVLRRFEGRPVLLYNKANRADNPMRCVEFKNTTGLTLEGGPVTVLESGSYTGEAMLETMKPNEQRLLAYAVELGVFVLDNVDSYDDSVHRVILRDGIMKTFFMQVRQTAYRFNNKTDQDQILYLEHPRPLKEAKLWETPEPFEITEHYWRFRVSLPARKLSEFRVKHRQSMSQAFNVSSVTPQQIALWLSQKYIDAAAEQALGEIVKLRAEEVTIQTHLKALEDESKAIHHEQQRIRDNLQSLGDRPAEKELRERFVRTLNTQEDRLEVIQRDLKTKINERDQARQRLRRIVGSIQFDAEIKK